METDNEKFEIEIEHGAKVHVFPAELKTMGYTYKIAVVVFGSEVVFEPDEERNFRAVIDPTLNKTNDYPVEILQKIAQFLEEVFK